jgi:bifunctional enzyme CysN/CysC
MSADSVIRLVTCGSVDDGKSTLIGRLLSETDSIPLDTLHQAKTQRRSGSLIPVGEIDFSLLTDGLEAEREQGITIDVAYRSMTLTSDRRLIIADAPGHEEYTRNMVVAASRSEIGLVIVDAHRGIRPQTLRHLSICSLVGVHKIIVAINKMDAVDYSADVFDTLRTELEPVIDRLGHTDVTFIPLSALAGDNVTVRTDALSWFAGNTLLDEINAFRSDAYVREGRARFNAQIVSRDDNFRGIAGTVTSGKIARGDEVVILPRGTITTVDDIITFDGTRDTAVLGDAVTLTFARDVDASRGDVIEKTSDSTTPADSYQANLVWLDNAPLVTNRSYVLINGFTRTDMAITEIRHRINVETGAHEPTSTLNANDIAEVQISLSTRIALDSYYDVSRSHGNFIVVDRLTRATVGAGMVTHPLRRGHTIGSEQFDVNKVARAAQKGHGPRAVWITGLPGSGKSTLANELEKKLHAAGFHSYILDGDNLRHGLNRDLGFTEGDRAENVRRLAEVGRLMVDAGLVVIIASVSPHQTDREMARDLFDDGEFVEVWLDTPLEVCAARDTKGLFAKAASGSIPNLTGVGSVYEAPRDADIHLDGTRAADDNSLVILDYLR